MRIVARRRHVDVMAAPQPEHEGGDEHQHARNTERHRRPPVPQEQRRQQRGEERAEVDDPVEGVEDQLGLGLVALVELVAAEGDHQRLDPARAQGDEEQAGVEAGGVVLEQRQAGMAGAVDQREPEDGVVLAEVAVGQPAAEQREEVHADHEHMEYVLGGGVALGALGQVGQQDGADQERHQDVAHPVEAEPFAGLVADDVGNLARHAPGVCGGCAHRRYGCKRSRGYPKSGRHRNRRGARHAPRRKRVAACGAPRWHHGPSPAGIPDVPSLPPVEPLPDPCAGLFGRPARRRGLHVRGHRPGACGRACRAADDRGRAQRLPAHRTLRGGRHAGRRIPGALSGPCRRAQLRYHPRGPADAAAGGDRDRCVRPGRGPPPRAAGGPGPGRHPRRRDRRQGRRLPGPAPGA